MLARRTNGHGIHRLRDEMDRLFDSFFADTPVSNTFGVRTYPALNIWEDDNALFIEAELPGMNMKDVEVLVAGKELTLKGEAPDSWPEGTAWHRRERPAGRFSRMVQLPVGINQDQVAAQLRNGVLLITLPKAEEVRPRRIEVKSLGQ